MDRDDILYLVRYHNRANAKIFDTAAQLTGAELTRPNEFDRGSAFETLRHIVDVDWSWRQFCNGNDVGKTYLWELEPMTTFAEIRAVWERDSRELLAYAESLDDASLDQEITLNAEKGERARIWQVLAHVVNHGTQHRSELARYFTVCGHSPGDLDLL
jgi:uncharacterized damage-inducible protein DinB